MKLINKLKDINAKRKMKKLIDAKNKYQNWLRSMGATIGKNVDLFPGSSTVDSQTPYLLNIGDNVCFAKNVSILNHDYSTCVIRREFGDVHGGISPVYIGNNCFIGINATILRGTHIGNNCIIGANSVVHGNIPDGEVWAGNPAKKICTTKEMLDKWESRQVEEAKVIAKEYYKKFNKIPPENMWRKLHYFVLWTSVEDYDEDFKNDFGEINNPKMYATMNEKKRPFKNYEEFISTIDFKVIR